MENGKHSIARDLIDGFGFGTTEFHVLRPTAFVTPEWIHLYLRQPSVLKAATAYFSGTVGQQRVSTKFFQELSIPLPPLSEQKRIVEALTEQLDAVERALQAVDAQIEAAKAMPAAYLRSVFESDEAKEWRKVRLGLLLRLRKEVVHPYDKPSGQARFVGLEHIESATGVRTGGLSIEMSELTGRKPRFWKGDIVYGYLRPISTRSG